VRVPCVIRWPGHIQPGSVANGIQSHEDLYVTLAAAAGLPNLKDDLLKGYKMGEMTYKVHLDGYNNMDYWTGKSPKSARREFFYYDETDLMAIRVGPWKLHIGVKHNGDWFDEKSYPSVPYVVNLLMDPMEKVTPDAPGFEYEGRKFFASKLWAPTGAGPFLAAHLKSLEEYPPSQGADTLSMKKAVEDAMKKATAPNASSN
jgi:arylsulfatase